MAESREDEPKRCRCGFWGSPQTMNLCSRCYKDYQQNMKAAQAGGDEAQQELLKKYFPTMEPSLLAQRSHSSGSSEPQPSEKGEENEEESERRDEGEPMEEDSVLPIDRPVQTNKKRCWTCRAKLELAKRQLGTCKCDYVFCSLHRLPEQHQCIYDHKEGGRREALKNMVTANRKIGRSFHRMDSRPE